MTDCMRTEIAALDDNMRSIQYVMRQLDHALVAMGQKRETLAYEFKRGKCQCADCMANRVFNKLEG